MIRGMNRQHGLRRRGSSVLLATCLFFGLFFGPLAHVAAQATGESGPAEESSVKTETARGTFDVDITPEANDEAGGGSLGRMRLDKRYHGDLEATAAGTMLTAMTGVQGSAGYVAIERVTGTLGGRSGSFVLQHSGTMTRGTPRLEVSVVPDSGTGELAGLAGRLEIEIGGGVHSYVLKYTLPVDGEAR